MFWRCQCAKCLRWTIWVDINCLVKILAGPGRRQVSPARLTCSVGVRDNLKSERSLWRVSAQHAVIFNLTWRGYFFSLCLAEVQISNCLVRHRGPVTTARRLDSIPISSYLLNLKDFHASRLQSAGLEMDSILQWSTHIFYIMSFAIFHTLNAFIPDTNRLILL
jgi:hypothetical protein